MMIFGKTPTRKLSNVVAELRARADKLEAKRIAAQGGFDAAQAEREKFFLGGDVDDDGAAEKLRARVDSARGAVDGLNLAIKALAAQQADAERALADEKLKAERKIASEALAAKVATAEADLKNWIAASRDLATKLEALDPPRWDAGRLGTFIRDAAGQSELAVAVLIPDLHSACERIKSGADPIPVPPAPFVPVKVIVPPVERVFLLRNVKWRGGNGQLRTARRFSDLDLPPNLARHAIKSGAACAIGDARRKESFGLPSNKVGAPDPRDCETLDTDAEPAAPAATKPSAEPPIKHAMFEPMDRGKPYTARISVPRGAP